MSETRKRKAAIVLPSSKRAKTVSDKFSEGSRLLEKTIAEHAETIHRLRHEKSTYNEEDIFEREPGLHVAGAELNSQAIQRPPDPPAGSGFRVDDVANPFLVGRFPNPIFDPQEWAKEINDRMEKAGLEYFPTIPCVVLFLGGINSGKTNLLCSMLTGYIHLGKVQNVSIISPTVFIDPTFASLHHIKSPDTKITFHTDVPVDLLTKDRETFERQVRPVIQAATQESRFDGVRQSDISKQLSLYSSIHHPHTDVDGTVLEQPVHIPPYVLEPQHRRLPSFKAWKGQKRKRSLDNVHQSDPLRSLKDPERFAPPDDASLELRTLRHHLAYNNEVFSVKTKDMKLKGKFGKLHFNDPPYKNRLVVLDDAAQYLTEAESKRFLSKYVTWVRHPHQSLFISAQKMTIFPPVIRAQVTDVFLWPVRSHKEFERIEEEYGDRVPNFKEAYDYCMQVTEDLPRPFMYINMRQDPAIVMRGFLQRLDFTSAADDAE